MRVACGRVVEVNGRAAQWAKCCGTQPIWARPPSAKHRRSSVSRRGYDRCGESRSSAVEPRPDDLLRSGSSLTCLQSCRSISFKPQVISLIGTDNNLDAWHVRAVTCCKG